MKLKLATAIIASLALSIGWSQKKYPSVLWEIKKNKTDKPSYLFGTYHTSSKGVFKLGDSIFIALKNVDMVGTEIDDNTWQQNDYNMEMMKRDYNNFNSSPSTGFIDEGYLRKTNTLKKLPAFISAQSYKVNYFLYRNNSGNEDYEEEAYLDMFLSSVGYKFGKKIVGLENYMGSRIKEIEADKAEQAEEKKENRKLPEGVTYRNINDLIFDDYKNNSLEMLDSLDKYNFESEGYYKHFIIDRNYIQADSIAYNIGKGSTIFAAVGAAHLPGNEGVIEILRRKGFTLRPVMLKGHAKAVIDSVKKITYPIQLSTHTIDGMYSITAPGPLYCSYSNALLKMYNHVDMANGGYFVFSRLYNNAYYFNATGADVINSIDSLLYENVTGEIVSKNKLQFQGYPAIDVVTKVKNKDLEKYRFIVTPYEVLKLKVGGKNEYVNNPQISSFFSSFKINASPAKQFNNVAAWHTWYCDYMKGLTTKVRYTYYDSATNNTYGVMKLLFAERRFKPDEDYYLLASQSLAALTSNLKGDSLYETELTKQKLISNKIMLQKNGTVYTRYILKFPFMYVLHSTSYNGTPDTSWMTNFTDEPTNTTDAYAYTDSLKAVAVTLPYKLSFDAKWKSATEKKVIKPDNDKKVNRSTAIEYERNNVYFDKDWDGFCFQDTKSLELMWAYTCNIDSHYYYSNARKFWEDFIPKPMEKEKSFYRGRYSNTFSSEYSYSTRSSNKERNTLSTETEKIINVVYDTTKKDYQTISYITIDTLSTKATYTKCILVGNKVYYFSSVVNSTNYQPSVYVQKILTSFKPFNVNSKFNVYESQLKSFVKKYKAANEAKKPDVSEEMNYQIYDIGDLNDVSWALNELKEQTPNNNIIRKKFLDAIGEIKPQNDNEWKAISNWLKKIYENKNELLTIRFMALKRLLSESNDLDIDWVTQQIKSNKEFQANATKSYVSDFIYGIKQKQKVSQLIPLKYFGNATAANMNLMQNISLYDSGFYSKQQMQDAFDDILKLAENEKLSINLKSEAEFFKYAEKEEKKENSYYSSNSSYTFYNELFNHFYAALSTDSFFAEGYKKILANGTADDKTDLLNSLLKPKQVNTAWINELLEKLKTEKTSYYEMYKSFLVYKKQNLAPAYLTNPSAIAYSLLKSKESSYSKSDTLYFIESRKSKLDTSHTYYFFKYRQNDKKNEQVAYVALPNNLSQILDETPDYAFTNEQIGKTMKQETVINRLIQKKYINYLFNSSDKYNGGFFETSKDDKPLTLDE